MNNCPKCGNPLQAGTGTCPICGTNINSVNNVGVAQTPVQPTPVTPSVGQPINNAPMQTPVTPINNVGMSAPAQPINTPVNQPQQPINVAPVQNPIPTPAEVTATTPVNPAPSVAAINAQPAVAQAATATTEQGVGTQPAAVPNNPAAQPAAQTPEKPMELPKAKKQLKFDKKIIFIIIAVLVVAVGVVVAIVLIGGKDSESSNNNNNNNQTNNNIVATNTSKVSSGGYAYNLPENWTTKLSDDTENIILINKDSNTIIYLDNYTGSLSTIDSESLKAYAESSSYTDVTVENITLGSRNCIVVNGTYNNYLTQFYFVEDGNALIVGAVIIYETEEAKTANEATVKTIVESLTYTEMSNAIDPTDMYGAMFQMFNNALINSEQSNGEDYVDDSDMNNFSDNSNDKVSDSTVDNTTTTDTTTNTNSNTTYNPLLPGGTN